MELKYGDESQFSLRPESSNRTFMELKYSLIGSVLIVITRF